MHFTDTEEIILQHVALSAKKLGIEAYAIGGFVRDKILRRPTKDIDFVCLGDGLVLAQAVAESLHVQGKISLFKTYGTAHFRYKDIDIEFVGARKESYHSDSRNPSVSPGTLRDDQLRRDLSINAMAISLSEHNFGELLDPFDGIKDIEDKRLRTPLDPGTTFNDDPLRMMRIIRFASQLNFSIDPLALDAICTHAKRIKIISRERITDEMNKILLSTKPSIGLALLHETGLLKEFFPKLSDLAGAEYIDGKGHKDNFYHTIQVVDNIAAHTNKLWLRWAALLHDIGKPATKRFEVGLGWTFHGHEWVGGKMVPAIFKEMKLPLGETLKYVQKLVVLHLRPISLTKENITDSALRRLLFDAGEDIDDLMKLCHADITSKNQQKVKRFRENFELVKQKLIEVEERDKLRNWQPPITGEIIMKTFQLPPGREVGIIKTAVREAILDGIIANSYNEAFQYMLTKAKEMNIEAV